MANGKALTAAAAICVGIVFGIGTTVKADETTTTTTTRTDQPARTGVTVGVPGVVGVEVGKGAVRSDDCATRTMTKTNEETGTTVSKTATNCP